MQGKLAVCRCMSEKKGERDTLCCTAFSKARYSCYLCCVGIHILFSIMSLEEVKDLQELYQLTAQQMTYLNVSSRRWSVCVCVRACALLNPFHLRANFAHTKQEALCRLDSGGGNQTR